MIYAAQGDVLARAGRFAGLFSVVGKRPNLADLDDLLEQVSAEIDVEIQAHGYDPASLDADLVTALTDVAAWAVLVRALPEASPGDNATEPTIERGVAILNASGFKSLAEGGVNVLEAMGAIAALEAGSAGGGPGTSAGSLWDDLPEETLWSRLRRGDVVVASMGDFGTTVDAEEARGPQFHRGMSL